MLINKYQISNNQRTGTAILMTYLTYGHNPRWVLGRTAILIDIPGLNSGELQLSSKQRNDPLQSLARQVTLISGSKQFPAVVFPKDNYSKTAGYQ